MPLFYQHNINEWEKLGIWKIEEDEAFFSSRVPLQRNISHAHKRLQHLAGRYLLKYLFPDFPSELIEIADTRKPFLPNETYHFSISHCGHFAAALVSKHNRVGIDIELVVPTIEKIQHKFLDDDELALLQTNNAINTFETASKPGKEITKEIHGNEVTTWASIEIKTESQGTYAEARILQPEIRISHISHLEILTICWSSKEAIYKWFGNGGVDFKKHMQLLSLPQYSGEHWLQSPFIFSKEKEVHLDVRSRLFEDLMLAYVIA